MHARLGDRIKKNCIDCHLPKLEGKKMKFFTQDSVQAIELRDHYITIYEQATQDYLDALPDDGQETGSRIEGSQGQADKAEHPRQSSSSRSPANQSRGSRGGDKRPGRLESGLRHQ